MEFAENQKIFELPAATPAQPAILLKFCPCLAEADDKRVFVLQIRTSSARCIQKISETFAVGNLKPATWTFAFNSGGKTLTFSYIILLRSSIIFILSHVLLPCPTFPTCSTNQRQTAKPPPKLKLPAEPSHETTRWAACEELLPFNSQRGISVK